MYSKKVEYLHNLVFRALETIHSKKQKERTAAEEGGAKRGARQVRQEHRACACARMYMDVHSHKIVWVATCLPYMH